MHTLPSNCRSFVAAAVQSYYIEAPEFNLCDEVINYARDKTNKYIQDAEDYGAEYILAISSISIELFKSKSLHTTDNTGMGTAVGILLSHAIRSCEPSHCRSFFETKDDFIWWLQLDRTTKNQFISYIQNTTPDKFILNNRIINNMSSIIKTFQFIIELIYDGVRDSSIKHIMKDPSISSELLNNFRGDHVINQKLTIKLETQLSKIFSRTSFFEDQFRKPIESTKIEDKIEMLRYLKSYCDDVSYALLITFIRKETKRLMSANEFNIRMHHMARLYLAPNPKFQNELDNWVKHKK